ncbi:HAD family hydrolase [uncultured Fibrobacter sp.]|uniref:HAD-IIA family hydrolase n=1 Tax=uncultured Fibrobacter sp. TaxID=261512 RepID=UPI002600C28A|nr:HAD family hydrolase [uncultured Fibrobacter sp.]
MDKFETEIYLRYKQIIESQKACSFTCRPGLVPGSPFLCKTELSSWRALPDRIQSDSCAVPRHVYMADLLERYDAFCFDGYGTLYNRGSFVYPGAMEWFKMLRRAGKHLRLVTNAASDVDEVLARDADKRGFDFSTEETISSGCLLKDLCAELRSRGLKLREVYYIGRETGKHVLDACGITAVEMDAEPAELIVAISSAKDTPETYARAVKILQRPGAILLVLNSDAWAPKIPDENGVTVREPVSGALSERLRRDSMCDANGGEGCETYYLGKPFPQIWERVKVSLPAGSRVLMIGDTLGTDVYGAKIAGFDSALVVGRNVPAAELSTDEAALGIRPDYYLVP